MPTAREVDPWMLIATVKEELKKIKEVKPPEWAKYAKTGHFKQRPPEHDDWWYIRAASIMRKLYLHGPKGVSRLRTAYGGRKDRGARPCHFYKASGHHIRLILQQLEKAGFVEKIPGKGRKLTPKGVSFLDKISNKILSKGAE